MVDQCRKVNLFYLSFWNEIEKLKSMAKSQMPLKVYGDEGKVINDIEYVMQKWKREFGVLL